MKQIIAVIGLLLLSAFSKADDSLVKNIRNFADDVYPESQCYECGLSRDELMQMTRDTKARLDQLLQATQKRQSKAMKEGRDLSPQEQQDQANDQVKILKEEILRQRYLGRIKEIDLQKCTGIPAGNSAPKSGTR